MSLRTHYHKIIFSLFFFPPKNIMTELLRNTFISLEGIIGCGKSTTIDSIRRICIAETMKPNPDSFCNFLANNLEIINEPVEEFTSFPDSRLNPMLEGYRYGQPGCGGNFLAMQFHIMEKVAEQYQKCISQTDHFGLRLFLSERNPDACRVFADFGYKTHQLETFAHEYFIRKHTQTFEDLRVKPTLSIFLDTQPCLAKQRLRARGREWEQNLSLDDLTLLRTINLRRLTESGSTLKQLEIGEENTPEQVARCVIDIIKQHLMCGQ